MKYIRNISSAILLGAFVVIVAGDIALWLLVLASIFLIVGISLFIESELDQHKIGRQGPPGPPGPAGPPGRIVPIDMPRKNYYDD